MTGEEMERAIEFLLQSHATFESRLDRIVETMERRSEETDRRFVQTNKQIEILADSQNDLTQIVARLADSVERFISQGGNGQEKR